MKRKKRICIGIFNPYDYAVRRNIYQKADGYEYREIESRERRFIAGLVKIFHLNISFEMKPGFLRAVLMDRSVFYAKPRKKDLKEVDFIHAWNQVCVSPLPWGMTLETKLPHDFETGGGYLCRRYEAYVKKRDLKLAAHANCRFIITFSQNTYDSFQNEVSKSAPGLWKSIHLKTSVLLPPQRRLISDAEIEQKYRNNTKWKLFFCGRDFLVKGGMEMISALRDLRRRYTFELILISPLHVHSQGFLLNPQYAADEIEATVRYIKHAPWIHWYESMDNNRVIRLMKECQVGLFPSYGDTFGYVVMEMQACGCPVISTDVNALRELNNEHVGWICPLSEYRDFLKDRQEQRYVRERLVCLIQESLEAAFQNRDLTEQKAKHAAKRIEEEFSEERFAKQIKHIYRKAGFGRTEHRIRGGGSNDGGR